MCQPVCQPCFSTDSNRGNRGGKGYNELKAIERCEDRRNGMKKKKRRRVRSNKDR